jgi:hypothetical protein
MINALPAFFLVLNLLLWLDKPLFLKPFVRKSHAIRGKP